MLGAEIDGYRVLAVAYIGFDPSKDVIALVGTVGPTHPYVYGVVKMSTDGQSFAEEVGDTTDHEQTVWEAFGDRSA